MGLIDSVLKYWPIVIVVIQFFMMWAQWSLRKEFVTHTDLAKAVSEAIKSASFGDSNIQEDIESLRTDHHSLHERVTEGIDKRLLRLEENIKHMPTHQDLTRLHQRMDDFNAGQQKIVGSLDGLKHTMNLIQQYLLNGGKS